MTQRVDEVEAMKGLHAIEYPFRRSTGPVLSKFFTGLRNGKIVGIRSETAGVLVPPAEYDPNTAAALDDFVDVGPGGEVVSWSWVAEPRTKHLIQHPFAFALVKLDGADASLLHMVDTGGDRSKMSTGMRVAPRWAADRQGVITDIEAFVPEAEAQPAAPLAEAPTEDVKSVTTPIRLEYDFIAGKAQSVFLHGIAEGKLLGAKAPGNDLVYVPPRGADPRTAELTPEFVEVSDHGTVVTYSIVRVPSENIPFELPYVCINVLLDGAHIPFFHVLQNCELDDVRIGMRVKAKWLPKEQLEASITSIEYFEPSGEPDVPFEQVQEYC